MPISPGHSPAPRRPAPPLLGLALGVVACLLVAGAGKAHATGDSTGRVQGHIVGAADKEEVVGIKVVLVQFKLDTNGNPQGAPIQIRETDAAGHYVFDNVPTDSHSVFKLGARVSGSLVATDPFTFPAGQREVTLNLQVPQLVTDASGLRFVQTLVALEPYVGGVTVTEVVHVENPTPNVIDEVRQPLELSLPVDAADLQMVREEQDQPGHTQLGSRLLVYGHLHPGTTTIAFRYRLDAGLGTLRLEKRYPHPVDDFMLIVPRGSLRISSETLNPRPQRQFDGVWYDTWGVTKVAPRAALALKASRIPVRQEIFLIPLAGFFLVMAAVVLWFLRRRLAAAQPPPSA